MKTVTAGEHGVNNVIVDGSETVKFSFASTCLAMEVLEGEVTVALTDTAVAGDDGTRTISEGTSGTFPHQRMGVDTYYLTGTGKVNLWASNKDDTNPFDGKAKGGDGGGDNTHYKGTTTTPLENGSTTNPITIDGESYTAVFGDVVVYGYTEFVFDGTAWSEFGRPFDTTPTSGSTNAVTSDGIYKVTPFKRGTGLGSAVLGNSQVIASGEHSVAIGSASQATKRDTFAAGYYAVATGDYSSAFGFDVRAGGIYAHVVGKNNRFKSGDLFEIGNGYDPEHTSNIVEVNNTRLNVNGDIQINNVALPTPYTTMPAITESMLGKVVQYVGTSDSNYKQGWKYVAVSDGEETPTYSWKALMDTTPTQGSTNAVTSDGVYRNTAGRKNFSGYGTLKGEEFNDTHNVAAGQYSHAEGSMATASGHYSHAEGASTKSLGNRSHAEGWATTASGNGSHSEGDTTTASGDNSHAGGTGTIANKRSSTAIGKYNVADTDVAHLLIVGNGAENARSNILEVSETDMNVNGDIKINNIAIPIPYTTMPTITADMLGEIAMYVGATGGGFTQGCFYVASTDGATEPTYSWVQIGGGRTETVLWENEGTTNPDAITLSEAWSNFDELVVVTVGSDSIGAQYETPKHPSVMAIGGAYTMWYNSESTWGTYSATSSTVFTKLSADGDYHIAKIIGIKY